MKSILILALLCVGCHQSQVTPAPTPTTTEVTATTVAPTPEPTTTTNGAAFGAGTTIPDTNYGWYVVFNLGNGAAAYPIGGQSTLNYIPSPTIPCDASADRKVVEITYRNEKHLAGCFRNNDLEKYNILTKK